MIFASSFGPKTALTLGALLALPALFFSSGCAGDDTAGNTGGNAGVGGTGAGMSGSGGMTTSGTGGALPLPDATVVGCDYQPILTKSCAAAACHRATLTQGSLDLTVNDGLRSRIVNVPAAHSTIDCDPDPVKYMECVPPPAACTPGDKYIDTAVPANSWLIKKLDVQNGCGDQMPMPPGNSANTGWDDVASRACLVMFFNALAAGK